LREKVEKQIETLIDNDIIERVEGPTAWVSPTVPIIKKSGEIRLCVNMRRVNEAIMRERYPLPVLEDILDTVRGNNWFSTVDIKSAYHQIELDEESRKITTFVTSSGLYRYKRLMFGINCAPEIYQRIIRSILRDCEGTINFIDDIIICGKTREQHDKRLEKVFETLREKGITLNKSKCVFRKKEITFMGFRISGNGYQPLESKVEAVEKFRTPRTAEEIRSFLGLVNFCAAFISNLATVSEPLRRLTKKGAKFIWEKEQEKALKILKTRLASAETLGIFNLQAKTRVIADASPVALGGVLTQQDENNQWRVISYASRSLSDCERRYSQTEKEALALVFACERFYNWLYGIEFQLVTDHKALEYIFAPRTKPNARIERWVLRLLPFKYKVIYEKGKSNIADVFSRLCKKENQKKEFEEDVHYIRWVVSESVPRAMTLEEIAIASENDKEIREIKLALQTDNWKALGNSRYKIIKEQLCIYNNVLLRNTRIIIPKKLQKKTLVLAHEGHPGIVAMK